MANINADTAQKLAQAGILAPDLAEKLTQPPAQTAPEQVAQPQQQLQLPEAFVPSLKPELEPGTSPLMPRPELQPETVQEAVAMANPTIAPPVLQKPKPQPEMTEPQKAGVLQAEAEEAEKQQLKSVGQQLGKEVAAQKAEAAQVAAQEKIQENVQQQVQEENKLGYTSLQDLMQRGTLGQKIGAALAILVGGVSQGLTGAKENPALAAMNTAFDQEARRAQLGQQDKELARRAMYDDMRNRLEAAQQQTDSDYKKQQIQLAKRELDLKIQDMDQKRVQAIEAAQAEKMFEQAFKPSTKAASPQIAKENEQMQSLLAKLERENPKKAEAIRERTVILPNGKIAVAQVEGQRVRKFEEKRSEAESAINLLEDIRKFANTASSLNLSDRQQMQSKLQLAAGKLRVPITGPGAMTDKEFERLLDTLGNPTAIFSVRDIENAKLDGVTSSLKKDLAQSAAAIGVEWPKTIEDRRYEKFLERGYSPAEAARLSKGR